MAEWKGKNIVETFENTEYFIVSLIDAAIAAEPTGLSVCYIGGIRNNLYELQKILPTPSYVIPWFGMAIGIPDETRELKSSLPYNHIFHREL